MAQFIVRVELHDGTRDDYTRMHQLLAAQGIVDIITSSDGKRYKLPPAEYTYVGNATIDQVRATCQQAAAKVVQSYAVLVTQSVRIAWSGLQEVGQPGTRWAS